MNDFYIFCAIFIPSVITATSLLVYIFRKSIVKYVVAGIGLATLVASIATYYVAVTKLQNFLPGFLSALLTISVIVWVLKAKISSSISQLKDQLLDPMCKGDFSSTTNLNFIKRKDEFGDMATSIVELKENLQFLIRSIKETSNQVLFIGEANNKSSINIANAASNQAESSKNLLSNINEIAEASDLALNSTEHSTVVFNKLKENMKLITDSFKINVESVNEISKEVEKVNTIASQTNLLALNASIEASRVGAQGKGFSVVASEVNMLSAYSKTAAQQIRMHTDKTLELSTESDAKLNDLLPDIELSSQLAQEVLIASKQYKESIYMVNGSVNELSGIAEKNAISAESMQSNSEELNSLAIKLDSLIKDFKV